MDIPWTSVVAEKLSGIIDKTIRGDSMIKHEN